MTQFGGDKRKNGRMRLKAEYWSLLLLLVISGAIPQTSQADTLLPWEKPQRAEDRFRVEFSSFFSNIDTTARIDFSPDLPGTEFNAESDFGLADKKTLLLPELTLLPGKRHLIRLTGFSLRRDATKTLQRDIDYDADSFLAGQTVHSTLDIDTVEASYGYRLVKMQRFETDVIIGVQLVSLNTNAIIPGITRREPSGDTLPIPLAGLEMRADLTRRLSVELKGHYVSVSIGSTSGSITDLRGALTWRLSPHLVSGLGFRSFDLSAESGAEDLSGLVHLKISGPLLFFRASL